MTIYRPQWIFFLIADGMCPNVNLSELGLIVSYSFMGKPLFPLIGVTLKAISRYDENTPSLKT